MIQTNFMALLRSFTTQFQNIVWFINKEESPHEYIRGTYSIDGTIEKGSQCTIKIYIDDEPVQYGTIGWPIQDNKIVLILGDYIFY